MSEFYIRGRQYSSAEIKDLTWEKFAVSNIQTLPAGLYKYFPNTIDPETGRNYSQEALENNTVFLQQPSLFDDPYDCSILVDEQEFASCRIAYYARLCGLKVLPEWDYSKTAYEFSSYLHQGLQDGKQLIDLIPIRAKNNKSVFEQQHEIFALSLQTGLCDFQQSENVWEQALYKAIHQEYVEFQEKTVKKFRVACFTESPYSMLMWAHYANSHQGFCIEYEVPSYVDPYIQMLHNLMPVIYSSKRAHIIEQCVRSLQPPGLTADILWDIYKYGLLMKSIDWKYQNEWRLVSYDNLLSGDNDYNCKFFKIKKVYLGNKMNTHDRLKIIKICKRNQTPYIGITAAPDRYEMLDCVQLCENCPKLNVELTLQL